jgi:hypothetical protein
MSLTGGRSLVSLPHLLVKDERPDGLAVQGRPARGRPGQDSNLRKTD